MQAITGLTGDLQDLMVTLKPVSTESLDAASLQGEFSRDMSPVSNALAVAVSRLIPVQLELPSSS